MSTTQFTDLPLGAELQRALRDAEHHTPTAIQTAAIPVILQGRDLLGCAQTGTGKTAAFALPLLQQLHAQQVRPQPNAPLALVLVPTRELAAQVTDRFREYGRHVRIWQTAIFGGVNQNPQVAALRRGVHVLIATPGRLIDLLDQGHVRLDQVRTLILDEADRMLDMGFLPPLRKIISKLPEERQSLCFSATMPREIADLVQSLLRDPHRIDVTPPSSASRQVEQKVIEVEQTGKRDLLQQILRQGDAHRVLVFTRTKRRADVVAKHLHQAEIQADAIHGDKSQNARTRALDRFKRGRIHVLVATDVAARGIDVDNISHVINYDLPHDAESYVHRIGRTGRASAAGMAITFFDPSEWRQIRMIERLIGQPLLPEGERRRSDEGGRGDRRQGERPRGERPQGVRPRGARPQGRSQSQTSGVPAQRSGSGQTPRGRRPAGTPTSRRPAHNGVEGRPQQGRRPGSHQIESGPTEFVQGRGRRPRPKPVTGRGPLAQRMGSQNGAPSQQMVRQPDIDDANAPPPRRRRRRKSAAPRS